MPEVDREQGVVVYKQLPREPVSSVVRVSE